MVKKPNIWVSPSDNGWKVHGAGSKRASNYFERKDDALNRGRQLAERNKSELISQKRDGKINFRNSYGHDPRNVKG